MWQKGKLNGVGGHIELGETPHEAMEREFLEEAGLNIDNWELGVIMEGKTWKVFFFFAYIAPPIQIIQKTDELICVERSYPLPLNVLPNLRWLIPLCLDADITKPISIYDQTDPRLKFIPPQQSKLL